MMKILAIETSCDETAAALVEASGDLSDPNIKVLSKSINSQIDAHKEYGGVYPSLAKREHARNIVPVVSEVLESKKEIEKEILKQVQDDIRVVLEREPKLFEASKKFLEKTPRPDVDMIAVTSGPGLEPALWVGINFAKALSLAWNIPLIPVNHMEGHIASVLLKQNRGSKSEASISKFETNQKHKTPNSKQIKFPTIGLLISGGHTELVEVSNWNEYKILGKTKDDAVGESYDKVARMLGFPYPGGPKISELAAKGRAEGLNDEDIVFPRPMINSDDLDFSFSGLKTAVLYKIQKLGNLSEDQKIIIAREFEDAVTDVLVAKTKKAIKNGNFKSLIVAGGVVANKHIREKLNELDIRVYYPEFEDCTDNAQMIAATAYIKSFQEKPSVNPNIKAEGNLTYKT
jgi:N6-L-threonylcarbamoyladenine synthase